MSKEGLLTYSQWRMVSQGMVGSGPVTVEVTQSDMAVTSLAVQAFEHRYELAPEQLAALEGGLFNGGQVTYGNSLRTGGGRTVYIVLFKGFVSGAPQGKLVVLHESGRVSISDHPEVPEH